MDKEKRAFFVKVDGFEDALIFAETHSKAKLQVATTLKECGYAISVKDGFSKINSCNLSTPEAMAEYTKARTWS
jgi:hypothetical protein